MHFWILVILDTIYGLTISMQNPSALPPIFLNLACPFFSPAWPFQLCLHVFFYQVLYNLSQMLWLVTSTLRLHGVVAVLRSFLWNPLSIMDVYTKIFSWKWSTGEKKKLSWRWHCEFHYLQQDMVQIIQWHKSRYRAGLTCYQHQHIIFILWNN